MSLSFIILCMFYNVVLLCIVIEARAVSVSHDQPSNVKHFERDLDTKIGYWSPSTSSIDWCERNYVVTQYVAEFWNCISSFTMCILGGILFIRGLYNNIESRFLLSSLAFMLVGLGSAYFHGTLTHLGQMADELPMVYSMILWWIVLIRMNDFEQKKNRIFSIDMLLVFGIFYGFLWTYVHNIQTFVLIFQSHMGLMVLGAIIKIIILYRQSHHHAHQIGYILIVYIILLIVAFVCWIIDQEFCEKFNMINGFNPQFHAWWHVLGGIHCHLGFVCGEAMRRLSIKYQQFKERNPRVHEQIFKADDHLYISFYLGLPYVDYSKDTRTTEAKCKRSE